MEEENKDGMHMPKVPLEKPKFKFRYTLWAPEKMSEKDTSRMGKFDPEDKRGEFPSIEFARKSGKFKAWYQIVDNYQNKVVEEWEKEYDVW